MNVSFYGMPIKVAAYKQQKKCHKNRLINWIFKKLYGYEEKSHLPDGTDMIVFDNTIYVRSEETIGQLQKIIEK